MMMIENEHFNCMKMVSCKVMTIENDDNKKLAFKVHEDGQLQSDDNWKQWWLKMSIFTAWRWLVAKWQQLSMTTLKK